MINGVQHNNNKYIFTLYVNYINIIVKLFSCIFCNNFSHV